MTTREKHLANIHHDKPDLSSAAPVFDPKQFKANKEVMKCSAALASWLVRSSPDRAVVWVRPGALYPPGPYTLFQNGHYFSGLLFAFKLALVASFLKSKFKRIFSLERGNKG